MQLTGKLVQLLPAQTGQGKNGPWKKKEFILVIEGTYPKKVCVAVWGDKADEKTLQVGNSLRVDVDVESREFNGRWYTDVKAWKIEATGSSTFTENDAFGSSFTDDTDEGLPF